MAVAFSAILDIRHTIALLPLACFAGAVGWVGLSALLTSETPAGAGIGGVLLGVGGFNALALGLPLFGLGSALCMGIRGHE